MGDDHEELNPQPEDEPEALPEAEQSALDRDAQEQDQPEEDPQDSSSPEFVRPDADATWRSDAPTTEPPFAVTAESESIKAEPIEFELSVAEQADPASPDDEWSGHEIEAAYQKALAALDDVAWGPGATEEEAAEPAAGPAQDPEALSESPPPEIAEMEESTVPLEAENAPVTDAGAPAPSTATTPVKGPRLAGGTERHPRVATEELTNVSPAQVIEATLFVGGAPLTAKKFCSLLRGSFDAKFVENTIDELNDQYVAEGRPYEIRLGDGGYRLELRPEFEKLRQRVYGAGPREVKLSQDVLEVLALVAYRQPITQQEIEGHGKQNAGNVLRQLLRRDLVAIERGEGGRKDVRYRTTPRFLTVFGLANLDELPQPEDLARK